MGDEILIKTNKIVIRPARPEDIRGRGEHGIRDLFNAVRRDERSHGRSPLAPPQYNSWARAMKKQNGGEERFQALVAESKGDIVGFCVATHLKDKPSTTLNKLFTASGMHGSGLGRRLIEAVRKESIKLGKTEIDVCAEAGEGRASGFYQH